MGEIADRIRGRKILRADDSEPKVLRLTTDRGDVLIIETGQFLVVEVAQPKPSITDKPITDAPQ